MQPTYPRMVLFLKEDIPGDIIACYLKTHWLEQTFTTPVYPSRLLEIGAALISAAEYAGDLVTKFTCLVKPSFPDHMS